MPLKDVSSTTQQQTSVILRARAPGFLQGSRFGDNLVLGTREWGLALRVKDVLGVQAVNRSKPRHFRVHKRAPRSTSKLLSLSGGSSFDLFQPQIIGTPRFCLLFCFSKVNDIDFESGPSKLRLLTTPVPITRDPLAASKGSFLFTNTRSFASRTSELLLN